MRRRWESMKGCLCAYQALVALHFLPGSIHAVPNLPENLSPGQGVHYALTKANDPDSILFAYSTNSVAAEEMRRVSRLRMDFAEQQLQSFIEISRSLFPSHNGLADIVPLHDIIALTLESAKALMESQASKITMLRSSYNPSPMSMPSWVPNLTLISHVLRKLSLSRYEDGDATFGEDIANGCSNLIGSMVRTVQEWMTYMESEAGAHAGPSVQQQQQHYGQLSTSQASLSNRSVSPMPPPKDLPSRSSTTSEMPMTVDTNFLCAVPNTYAHSYVSSDAGWMSNEEQRPVSAPGMMSTFGVMSHEYTPPPSSMVGGSMELTPPPPPLAPLKTVTPPAGMTLENAYPVPPPAPATATSTQTQHLDHLLSEMFGYGGYPSQQSAPPISAPVFPPPSPVRTASSTISPSLSTQMQMPQQMSLQQQQQQTPDQNRQQQQQQQQMMP